MDDPVLHRKVFRQQALKIGALKPKRYVVGGGPGFDMPPIEPYYTTESQGEKYREFVKDGRRYVVDSKGNIVRTDYLPAKIESGASAAEGLRPAEGISGKIYKGLETIFDPESAYKRGTYGNIIESLKPTGSYLAEKAKAVGSTLINPETYTKTIPQGIYKGVKAFGPGIAGFAGADELAEATGSKKVKGAVDTGLTASAGAELAAALGARSIPYVGGALNLTGGPARLLANPYVGIPVGIAGAGAYALKKRDEYLKAHPEAFQQADTGGYNEMGDYIGITPDNTLPTGGDGGGAGTTGGGQPPSGGEGGVTTPYTGPSSKAPFTPEQPLETKIADVASATADQSVKKTGAGGVKSVNKKTEPSWFDKIGDFARSASGNAFMLKFAAGLLSGKGNFGEVVGNALNPAVDLFAAYKLKEEEMGNKQLLEMMKLANRKQEIGSFPLIDAQGNKRYVQAVRDEESKQPYIQTMGPDGKPVLQPIPFQQWGMFRTKEGKMSPELSSDIDNYGQMSEARAILHTIANTDPKALGTSGAIKNVWNTVIGVGGGVGNAVSTIKPTFDDKSGEKMWDKIDEKSKQLFDKLDKSSVDQLAKLKINQTTLKYYLANGLKDKDRLTNNDLMMVDKMLDLLSFTGNPKDIKARVDEIDDYLSKRQAYTKEKIHGSGVTDSEFASMFYGNPNALRAAGMGFATQQKKSNQPVDLSKMTEKDREAFLKGFGF